MKTVPGEESRRSDEHDVVEQLVLPITRCPDKMVNRILRRFYWPRRG